MFDKIAVVLGAAGGTLADLIETTSCHLRSDDHSDAFLSVRMRRLSQPFPAWTAVEVSGLRRRGALVEVRAVAAVPSQAR